MAKSGDIIHLRLASYQLQQIIGTSTYGEVWRTRAEGGLPVALKLVHTARMHQQASELQAHWLRAAHKEILFLRSLSPWDERHIVRLIDDGMQDGIPVLALELMAGDLYQHLQNHPATPLERCLQWLAQINQALAKVHQYGWRYLDLKPANLLLSTDRQTLKLADFGTSHRNLQLCNANDPQQQTAQQHDYRGTANWQAPEQFFPARFDEQGALYTTDARTDYFALGALFYYLLTQGLPLRFCSLCGQSFSSHQVQGALALQQATPLTLYPDEEQLFLNLIDAGQERSTPSMLARAALGLLQQLLAAKPEQRPPHALAIARQIDALLAKVVAGHGTGMVEMA